MLSVKPRNPLVQESVRGLLRPGPAHEDYLLYLFIQACVLFIWWPKDTLVETLTLAQPPQTLAATMMAVGVTVSYFAIRAGTEEVVLAQQSTLRDWASALRLSRGRILAGYLGGHLLHVLTLIVLSMPLLLCAVVVSGGAAASLAWCLAAVVAQATFFRFAAASILLAAGRRGALTLVSTRTLLLAVYLLSAAAWPAASHLVLCQDALEAASRLDVPRAALQFIAIYTVASAALALVLARQIGRLRAAGTPA